jgi:primosomal replication protein N
MRYTPAGLPALDVVLEHESKVIEAGVERVVMATLRTRALGELAQKLFNMNPQQVVQFEGFLATPRNSRGVIFHLTHF